MEIDRLPPVTFGSVDYSVRLGFPIHMIAIRPKPIRILYWRVLLD